MRQSQLFTKTRKEAPSDEIAKNAQLLIKAGFVHKEMAGVYSYLPLGLIVLRKIENIIREEMNKIGGQELLMSTLQEKGNWEKTDRWDDAKIDNWFKTNLKKGGELGLGFTHEEDITSLMKNHIKSFRDLPIFAYQVQTKFRNEARAKSGIMRGREFLMKDLYSFSVSEEEHFEFYEKIKSSYLEIFKRVGLGEYTHLTFASGGSFSRYSHEFQTISEAGEDTIYLSSNGLAVNKEVYNDDVLNDLGLKKEELKEHKAIEVGNIFTLGTKFSEALDLNFLDKNGKKQKPFMGSYGIGLGRLMGTVVEILSDDGGIIWPKEISPFNVHLIRIGDDLNIKKEADFLYEDLISENIEVLYDDREKVGVGSKLADADLIGITYRIIISDKSLSAGGIEIKQRNEKISNIISIKEFKEIIKN